MPHTPKNDDDLIAKIAELQRAEDAHPEFGEIDAADRERCQAMAADIEATIPLTLRGVLALIEFAGYESEPAIVSAVKGLRVIVMNSRDVPAAAREVLSDELIKIEGIALCLDGLTETIKPHSDHEMFRYLGLRLKEHFSAAFDALEETGGAA